MPVVLLIVMLFAVAEPGWAFPGQTAAELIQALGPSANGYVAPPAPSAEAVRAGSAQLSSVYWTPASYDPLRTGSALTGILVATFDYRGPDLITRLQKSPPEVEWADLVSRSEVFLSFLPPAGFKALLAALQATWVVQSRTHKGSGDGYDLYALVSKDGALAAELSYSEKGEVPPPPDPTGKRPPTLNFWSRVTPAR